MSDHDDSTDLDVPLRESGEPLELPLVHLPGAHPCHSCAECCRYVAIEIDEPSTNKDYDHVLWYLAHRGVSVYVDWDSDWYVEFQTVCEELTDDGTCGIYRDRPEICSDFSWNECEKATGEEASKVHFYSADEFVEWMERKRPRAFARFQTYRTKLIAEREKAAANVRAQGATASSDDQG